MPRAGRKGAAMPSVTKAKPIAAKMRSVRIGVISHPQNCITQSARQAKTSRYGAAAVDWIRSSVIGSRKWSVNIDVAFPVPVLGTDRYAQLGDDSILAISLIWWKFSVKGASLL